jgi:hypothetical protein
MPRRAAVRRAVVSRCAVMHSSLLAVRPLRSFRKCLWSNSTAPAGTELYLGLVHDEDGVEGMKKRMAAARKYIGAFGVATECGIARARTPERVRQILEVHSGAAKEGA